MIFKISTLDTINCIKYTIDCVILTQSIQIIEFKFIQYLFQTFKISVTI